MRVLVICADGDRESDWLDVGSEVRAIQRVLTDYPDPAITCQASMAAEPGDLVEDVSSYRPDVVHFIGHGSPEGIRLRRPGDAGMVVVPGERLQAFFRGRGVKLVVLNSCYSNDQAAALVGVVPAVVGITGPFDDDAGESFSTAFYRTLMHGQTVEDALRNGADVVDLLNLRGRHEVLGNRALRLVDPHAPRPPTSAAGGDGGVPRGTVARPPTRSFGDLWSGSLLYALAVAAVVSLLGVGLGGTAALVPSLVAGALAGLVLSLVVTWFRYRCGVGGRPGRVPPQPGDTLGGWLLTDRLPHAGMHEGLYTARRGRERGVLKLVRHGTDAAVRDRAQRELRYLDAVRSRHVVRAIDGFAWPDLTCAVTEVAGTETIEDLVVRRRSGRRFTDAELYSIAAGSITGLADLHSIGVVHRDFSSTNIVVTGSAATIVDLGASVSTESRRPSSTAEVTIAFASPEHFEHGVDVTASSDVFSWASVMYYLVTGSHPFGTGSHEVLQGLLACRPDLSGCPPWLVPALDAAFARDRDARPDAVGVQLLLRQHALPTWRVRTTRDRDGQADRAGRRQPAWIVPALVANLLVLLLSAVVLLLVTERGPLVADSGASTIPTTEAVGEDTTTSGDGSALDDGPATSSGPATSAGDATTTEEAPPPFDDPFYGVWNGEVTYGDDLVFTMTLVLDQSLLTDGDAPGDQFGVGSCRGSVAVASRSEASLVLDQENTTARSGCDFGGEVTLAMLDGETGSAPVDYQWTNQDGTFTGAGTLERSRWVEPDDSTTWPTHLSQAPSVFHTLQGACVAGGPGCPPDWHAFPSWTACNADFCLAEAGDKVNVFTTDGYEYRTSMPAGGVSAALNLMFVGFSDAEALELLDEEG